MRNNGGGHANHTLFWEIMGPAAAGNRAGEIADAIKRRFGDFDEFKEAVKDAGVKRFGSGWAWLVHDGGKLAITTKPNQDNPLMDGRTSRSSASTCGSTPTT